MFVLRSGAKGYTTNMFYTYILFSKKLSVYYAGSTADLKIRLYQHNSNQVTSTTAGVPWRLVWYCSFISKQKALKFEKYLKSGSGFAFRNNHLI